VIDTAGIVLVCISIPLLIIATIVLVKYSKCIEGWIGLASFGVWVIIMSTVLWFGLQYWKYIHLMAGCVGTVAQGTDEDVEGVFRAGMAVGAILFVWAIAYRLMRGSDTHIVRFGVKEKCMLPDCCFAPTPPADTVAQAARRNMFACMIVNVWCILVIAMCAGAAGLWTARTNEEYDKFELVMRGRVAAERSDVPIFVGEFGTDNGKLYWFQHTVDYIRQHNLHWAYWALDGQKVGVVFLMAMHTCTYLHTCIHKILVHNIHTHTCVRIGMHSRSNVNPRCCCLCR
jgi:hypothetical protein